MKFLLRNVRLILAPGEELENGVEWGWLLVEEGMIKAMGPLDKEPVCCDSVIECGGDYIAPGLVDIHCHGALGRDAMEATPEAFTRILNYHASRGTTTTLLTTVASSLAEMLAVLECAKEYRAGEGDSVSQLVGIHLEGPYFSPYRRGAHRAEMLRHPSQAETFRLLTYASLIRRMTLAPELSGAPDLIRDLVSHGIAASAGHSNATDEEALGGFRSGITQVTHLHNAMSSLRKTGATPRRGLAEAALETSGVVCELIADGVHVAPELLREAWLSKGWEEIALVSDATAGTGLGEGESFDLGGLTCDVKNGSAWTGEGTARCLSGSTSTLFEGVRTMVTLVGVPLEEAVAMATLVPAKALGLDQELGSLASGKTANLIRFNDHWQLKGVWIGGLQQQSPL
jgi:N-acetylglucosamine-6-phosphate deacetylase